MKRRPKLGILQGSWMPTPNANGDFHQEKPNDGHRGKEPLENPFDSGPFRLFYQLAARLEVGDVHSGLQTTSKREPITIAIENGQAAVHFPNYGLRELGELLPFSTFDRPGRSPVWEPASAKSISGEGVRVVLVTCCIMTSAAEIAESFLMPIRRRSFWLLLVLAAPFSMVQAAEKLPFQEGRFEKGELKYVNHLPVLSVEGTPEEMGRQEAALTGAWSRSSPRIPSN